LSPPDRLWTAGVFGEGEPCADDQANDDRADDERAAKSTMNV